MIDRRLFILLALICITCKPAARPPAAPARAAGPQVRATVVTVRTTLQPANKTYVHTIVVIGDKARDTAERDAWRLYDLKAKRVTYVDDIARTQRSESFAELLTERRRQLATALPPHFPPARFRVTDETRPILGTQAKQSLLELGSYRRELWLARHPAIPAGLFAMMELSVPPSSPLAPMMRGVVDALAKIEGFPLLDHAELSYGKTRQIVDRQVIGIAQKEVPEAILAVPKEYKDLTRAQGAGGGGQ